MRQCGLTRCAEQNTWSQTTSTSGLMGIVHRTGVCIAEIFFVWRFVLFLYYGNVCFLFVFVLYFSSVWFRFVYVLQFGSVWFSLYINIFQLYWNAVLCFECNIFVTLDVNIFIIIFTIVTYILILLMLFYSPNYSRVNCLENSFKVYITLTLNSSDMFRFSQKHHHGAHYSCTLKLHLTVGE